jgi:hypothetical protein
MPAVLSPMGTIRRRSACLPGSAGAGESGFFRDFFLGDANLPYNRVLKVPNGLTRESLLRRLDRVLVRAGVCRRKHPVRSTSTAPGTRWSSVRTWLLSGAHSISSMSPLQTGCTTYLWHRRRAHQQAHQLCWGIRGRGTRKTCSSGDYACAAPMFPRASRLMQIADANG